LCPLALATARGMRISFKFAHHVQVVTVLTAFIRAHRTSQQEFVRFLAKEDRFSGCEEAMCMVASETAVCRARNIIMQEVISFDTKVLRDMNTLRESKFATSQLIDFIEEVQDNGVMAVRELEPLLHPLENFQQRVDQILKHESVGIMNEDYSDILDATEATESVDQSSVPGSWSCKNPAAEAESKAEIEMSVTREEGQLFLRHEIVPSRGSEEALERECTANIPEISSGRVGLLPTFPNTDEHPQLDGDEAGVSSHHETRCWNDVLTSCTCGGGRYQTL